jgi:hypothetical protein
MVFVLFVKKISESKLIYLQIYYVYIYEIDIPYIEVIYVLIKEYHLYL